MKAEVKHDTVIVNENPDGTQKIKKGDVVELLDMLDDDLCIVRFQGFNKIVNFKALKIIKE